MKKLGLLFSVAVVAGCASMGPVGGLEAGKLVAYECEGKSFSARIEEDYAGVRLRTHEGSANLARGENDEFKGDGWTLKTQGGMQLVHNDKVVAKGCKKSA